MLAYPTQTAEPHRRVCGADLVPEGYSYESNEKKAGFGLWHLVQERYLSL